MNRILTGQICILPTTCRHKTSAGNCTRPPEFCEGRIVSTCYHCVRITATYADVDDLTGVRITATAGHDLETILNSLPEFIELSSDPKRGD